MADTTTTAATKPGDPIRHFVRELTQRAADSSDLELGGIALALGMVANDVDTIEARIREQVATEIEQATITVDGGTYPMQTARAVDEALSAAARIARRA